MGWERLPLTSAARIPPPSKREAWLLCPTRAARREYKHAHAPARKHARVFAKWVSRGPKALRGVEGRRPSQGLGQRPSFPRAFPRSGNSSCKPQRNRRRSCKSLQGNHFVFLPMNETRIAGISRLQARPGGEGRNTVVPQPQSSRPPYRMEALASDAGFGPVTQARPTK